jgi:hypothetical protein
MSNSIGSLRLLGAVNWREFVETVSGIGETRDACLGLAEKYQDRRLADRKSSACAWIT